ncbi:MAG: F0F1 ATP synthase subunit B [Gammaproteobacteria bacterium]|nr:F0F1 ATP synthase subunit B [Gammaproteobacteria bacterium]MDH3766821.1 F0F1 ATP synthase subunit B [Gammaproteobacteria bacterium]
MDITLTLIGQSIAMLVFVLFCMKYIWPPMMQALEERRTTIADGLAAGERAQADLQKAQAEADTIVAEARGKALEIVDQANKRGTSLVEEARNDGKRERERQVEAAHVEIGQERNRVREELRGQVSAIAIASAEKILTREIDSSAHQDILSKLASEL